MSQKKWIVAFVIACIISVVGYTEVKVFSPLIFTPKKATIYVGTKQDPDTFQILNPHTHFRRSDNLIVGIEYKPKSSGSIASISSELVVKGEQTGKIIVTQHWVDSSDSTGYFFPLSQSELSTGKYQLELYRSGKLDTTLDINIQ